MNPDSTLQEPIALHPTVFVIFGITGDLANRKLLPALLSLYSKRLLPPRFSVIGFSRRSFSREEFRDYLRTHMNVRPGQHREEDIKHFLDHITYEQGLFHDPAAYGRLSARLAQIDDRWGQCSNKLFHLSVPPKLYEGVMTHLASSQLTKPCDDETGWTRVLIEKPFGDDIENARSLDKLLGKLFDEKQIFRIDHYLAKEALQNIMAFRFENPIFEPMWSREYIDKVHIKLFEKGGIEGRGAFYDPIGALRDVGQNHMLQMLSLIAMEPPKSYSVDHIRKERAVVMNALKKFSKKSLKGAVVKGQYAGYTTESGVNPLSQTETYFRIKTEIGLPRWRGVPFYIESGKNLADTKTEIDMYFKSSPKKRKKGTVHAAEENILTFRIQPDESIKIKFFVKIPGYGLKTEPKTLKFKYADVPSFTIVPNDYERLLHDAFIGDQTLFASTDEIMASWKFVTPIIEQWGSLPLVRYEKGAADIE